MPRPAHPNSRSPIGGYYPSSGAFTIAGIFIFVALACIGFCWKASVYKECRETHSALYCFHEVSR